MMQMSMALMEIANYAKTSRSNSLQLQRTTKENIFLRPLIQKQELTHAANNSSK